MKRQQVQGMDYLVAEGWMRDNCGLYGAELLIYARLYTLVQSNEYYAIRAADLGAWAGLGKQAAQDALDRLKKRGLVRKARSTERIGELYKVCKYQPVLPDNVAAMPPEARSDEFFRVEGWMLAKGLRTATEIIVYALIYSINRPKKQRDGEDDEAISGYTGRPDSPWLIGWCRGAEAAARAKESEHERENLGRNIRRAISRLEKTEIIHNDHITITDDGGRKRTYSSRLTDKAAVEKARREALKELRAAAPDEYAAINATEQAAIRKAVVDREREKREAETRYYAAVQDAVATAEAARQQLVAENRIRR